MSVQDILISCSECDFGSSTAVSFGRYKYETPEGSAHIDRELGWCSDCKKLASIEIMPQVVPTEEHIASEIAQLQNEMSDFEKSWDARLLRWMKLLGFRVKPSIRTQIIKNGFISSEIEIEELRLRLKMHSTTRLPRCLRCGSQAVFAMPKMPEGLDPEQASTQQPIEIGLKHPGCGGELSAIYSTIRFNLGIITRIYNQDGILLRTEE